MIFTIVILILLASAIFRGFHRGFVIEMLHLIGTVVVLLFARLLYQPLGTMISNLLTNLHLIEASVAATLIINLVAFFVLISLGWSVIRLLGRVSRSITWLPVIKQVNSVAGGIVSFVVTYLVILSRCRWRTSSIRALFRRKWRSHRSPPILWSRHLSN